MYTEALRHVIEIGVQIPDTNIDGILSRLLPHIPQEERMCIVRCGERRLKKKSKVGQKRFSIIQRIRAYK